MWTLKEKLKGKNTHTVPDSICSGENHEYEEPKSEDVKVQSVDTDAEVQEVENATTESKDDNTEDGSDDDDSDDESSTEDDDDDGDDISESDTEEESEEDTQEDETSGDDDDDEDDEGSSIPESCTEENTEDSDTQDEKENQCASTGNDTSGGTMHCEASGNTGSEIQDETLLRQKTEQIADKLISACSNSQNSSVKSGLMDSASSEFSLSEFVTLDALDEDSLFRGIDESELTADKRKGGTRGVKSLQPETIARSSPRKQQSEKLRELNNVQSSRREKSSVKRTRKSKSRSPSRDRRGRGTPREKSRNSRTPVKNRKICEKRNSAEAELEVNASESSKSSSVEEKVLAAGKENDIASSLEEGEIEDSLESSCELRRSPRKHPSSHRKASDGRGSRGSVKRRLASPPGRSKRTRRRSPDRTTRSSPRSRRRLEPTDLRGEGSGHSPSDRAGHRDSNRRDNKRDGRSSRSGNGSRYSGRSDRRDRKSDRKR